MATLPDQARQLRLPSSFRGGSARGAAKDSQSDIFKAKALLGYAPIVAFEDRLEETAAWYRTSTTTA